MTREKYLFSTKKIFSFLCKTYQNKMGDILNQISFFQSKSAENYQDVTRENSEYKTFSIPVKNMKKEILLKYLTKNQ